MKVGVFETGRPPAELADHTMPYPIMFAEMMKQSDLAAEYIPYSALDGEFPETVRECDAWVIMGSAFGANDEKDWMLKLEDLIREAASVKIPMIGICFGHQIIAKALGGKVVRADQGWGLGIQDYEFVKKPSWMDQNVRFISIPAVHQDQVVELPAGAEVIARNDFCAAGMVVYDQPIVTIQTHPEFSPDYAEALSQFRRGTTFPAEVVDAVMDSYKKPSSQAQVAQWFGRFLKENHV